MTDQPLPEILAVGLQALGDDPNYMCRELTPQQVVDLVGRAVLHAAAEKIRALGGADPTGGFAGYDEGMDIAADWIDPAPLKPDDGFHWHPLSECPDETACPIHGRDATEPTGPEDTPETEQQLHARFACPGWEYRTTEGPRKQWDDQDRPPSDEDGNPDPSWEVNVDAGREGWERFDYTEEAYWRRRVVSGPR